MKAVIFTYPPDYVAAAIAARQLQRIGVEPFLAIDRTDPELIVEGAAVVRTDFPRVGNLNGAACVRGIIQELLAVSGEDDEWVLKVDSDCLVFHLDWLAGRTESIVGRRGAERAMFGFCYAVRVSALPRLLRASSQLRDPFCKEDETMALLAAGDLFTFAPGSEAPLRGYRWSGDVEEWKRKGAVVFQPLGSHGRKEVVEAMETFVR